MREPTSDQQRDALLNTLKDAIFIVEDNGLCHMNREAYHLLSLPEGLPLEQAWLMGPLFEIYDERGRLLPDTRWPQSHVFRGEVLMGPKSMDVFIRTFDKKTHFVHVLGTPLYQEDGTIRSVLLICRELPLG
ncbi:hypothetical protein KSC_097500 [Ktedonobacter sp. SOSP1-52]|uniref:hypothetical protein n=1 Tax=Ktedonobacter sp. SOSP1-52 TaxID=2778366 RepID=UPI0019154D54|nr:hypothetical protein [Ktedonobacter sp. SOSP1-52]GHO70858.1 hypothetical protein KSC_097500 [Ktedonobacter sp. SOSP1-52]